VERATPDPSYALRAVFITNCRTTGRLGTFPKVALNGSLPYLGSGACAEHLSNADLSRQRRIARM